MEVDELKIQYEPNRKGGLHIVFQGHYFTKHCDRNGLTHWRCKQRDNFK